MIPDTHNPNTEEPVTGVVTAQLRQVRSFVFNTAARRVSLLQRFVGNFFSKVLWHGGPGLKNRKIGVPKVQMHSYMKTLVKAKLPWRGVFASGTVEASANTQEIDAFRMKAISLLLNHAGASVTEAMRCVRNTPIKAIITQSNDTNTTIISLRQQLMTFPGEFVEVQGSFTRKAHSRSSSTPIPESFSAEALSTQTGFPHPIQHTGWALCDVLLTEYPKKPSKTPLLMELLERKRSCALRLLPHGSLIGKAKAIHLIKRRVFDDNREIFLPLLARHMMALTASKAEAVVAYFERVYASPSSFTEIAITHKKFIDLFIEGPSRASQNESSAVESIRLWQQEVDSNKILVAKDPSATYLLAMESTLTPQLVPLAMQKKSGASMPENPTLGILLYKQQLDFLQELEEEDGSPDENTIAERLQSVILSDEACTQGSYQGNASHALAIVNELRLS